MVVGQFNASIGSFIVFFLQIFEFKEFHEISELWVLGIRRV